MGIEQVSWDSAEAVLKSLLPGAAKLLPDAVAEAGKAAGFGIDLYHVVDPHQSRSDESLLDEFLSRAGHYIQGCCIVVPDEAFDEGGTPFAMEAADIPDFVRTFPSMVFDGDLIVLCPSVPAVVAYQFEGPDSVMFVVRMHKHYGGV